MITIVNLKDRIRAMFLLVAIGDALGMPVETFSAVKIVKHLKKLGVKGRLTKYLRPDGHKWFDGRDAGTWTDDWLFTGITAKSLIRMSGFNMDDMAKAHLEPYAQNYLKNYGAGKATRESLKNLKNGVHWSSSGAKGSAGNGISMKISGISAYMMAEYLKIVNENGENDAAIKYDEFWKKMMKNIYDYTLMTHNSKMALASAHAQVGAVMYCLGLKNPGDFRQDDFLLNLVEAVIFGEDMSGDNLYEDNSKDRLSDGIIEIMKDFEAGNLQDTEYIVKKYSGEPIGYIMNSIPLSYALFLKNPFSISCLYDVVNAGGDTDTNAAIIGPMLGALNGTKVIPAYLYEGLWRKEEINEMAEEFCDKFEIKN